MVFPKSTPRHRASSHSRLSPGCVLPLGSSCTRRVVQVTPRLCGNNRWGIAYMLYYLVWDQLPGRGVKHPPHTPLLHHHTLVS